MELKNGCYGKNRAILPIGSIFQFNTTFPKDVQVLDNAIFKKNRPPLRGGRLCYTSPTLITTRLAVSITLTRYLNTHLIFYFPFSFFKSVLWILIDFDLDPFKSTMFHSREHWQAPVISLLIG